MSYETTIKLDDVSRITVQSDSDLGVWFGFYLYGASAYRYVTAEQARELAAALLDAAADLEPVDLTEHPIGGTQETTV